MIYSVDEIKEKCHSVFEQHSFVNKAYLFGSYSRGEATEKSDIDVFLDIEYPIGLEFFGVSMYLEDVLKKKVDVLSLNEVRNIMPEVERKGVLIYEREYSV